MCQCNLVKFKYYSKIWNEYALLSKRHEELKVLVFHRHCIYPVPSHFSCYHPDGSIHENDRHSVCGVSPEGPDHPHYREQAVL